ncbi:MAG: phosphohydrolase [Nitrospirales bacterium]
MSHEHIEIIDHSDWVEALFLPYREMIGEDYDAYRGHVYRSITYAMHFLEGNDCQRKMVETALVYHDIGLWSDKNLAYLEPSEALALQDNETNSFGLEPETLKAAIRWHHKMTRYSGHSAKVVNAVRHADWIDASQGMIRKGLTQIQVEAVQDAIPNYGFPDVLQRLMRDLGGSAIKGNLKVLRHVFKV